MSAFENRRGRPVAVIPARGGSKRIPRKNIRAFGGRPMIAHSIERALECGLFDRVIVSTDDADVRAVALSCGAEVPFLRPAHLADDHTGTTAVMSHAVKWLEEDGAAPSSVCCIYATAPFLRTGDLVAGLTILQEGAWSYVLAATTFAFPIFRSFTRRPDGGIEVLFPEHMDRRSQDLPGAWHDAGQFYWGRAECWLREDPVLGPRSAVVAVPRSRVQDIDTEEDWARAELLWKLLQAETGA